MIANKRCDRSTRNWRPAFTWQRNSFQSLLLYKSHNDCLCVFHVIYLCFTAVTEAWTPMKYACIEKHNSHKFDNIWNTYHCQLKCEETQGCKSVDYNNNDYVCLLSNENSNTVPYAFHAPCYDEPDNYQFSEIIGWYYARMLSSLTYFQNS